MTIYIVTSGEYSDYWIDGVFLDKYEADKYCAVRNEESAYTNYRVEEYEEGEGKIEADLDLVYLFIVLDKANSPQVNNGVYYSASERQSYVHESTCYPKVLRAYVYLTKDDPELAFKIGKDMIAKYKAEKEGIV